MDNSRRFTLTDFCIICGVMGILSCLLFPRVVAPASANADQASNPLASGVGSHGKRVEPYMTTMVCVKPPQSGLPGRINLVAFNNTGSNQPALVSQYASIVPIVIDGIYGKKDVDVAASATGIEAKFHNVPPGERVSVGVLYHLATPRPTVANTSALKYAMSAIRPHG